MGAEHSHDTLRQILASRKPCKVLDAAAGQGTIAEYLLGLGWDVHCADIFPEAFKVEAVPIRKVNLNRELPYEDASFDAVICANAIHRLFNPAGAMREFHRILRPGGSLYLNFNNYASIETRVRFLLFGSIETREVEQGIDPKDDPESDVRIRVMYTQLAQYLEAAGFEIVSVLPAPPRLSHHWLAPLAVLIWLLSKLIPAEKRRRNRLDVVNSRSILNWGHYALLEAIKQ
jgi:SAM-dependent methyltransferase